MNTKHTAGKWRVAPHGNDWTIRGDGNSRVLTISSGVIPMNPDARLIAAAPELLAELTRVVSWFEQFQAAQRSGGDMLELLGNVDLRDARAAIAKATGGSL